MVSKAPPLWANYHLASDPKRIIGARRWKGEKRAQGRGGDPPPNTSPLCLLNLGLSLISMEKQKTRDRVETDTYKLRQAQ